MIHLNCIVQIDLLKKLYSKSKLGIFKKSFKSVELGNELFSSFKLWYSNRSCFIDIVERF